MGGHQDHLALRLRFANHTQQIEAAQLGHPEIDDRHVGRLGLKPGERLARARVDRHVVAGRSNSALDQPQDTGLVVDDDQPWLPVFHVEEPIRAFTRATAASAAL